LTARSGLPSKMAVALTAEEEAMLQGELGPAPRWAMEVLLRMAELTGAASFVRIASAHVDGCLYEGDAVVDFVDHLVSLGARVSVPTTLNAVSVELAHWKERGVPPAFGEKAVQIVDGYLTMGARPSFSCSPYAIGHVPRLGEHVAWGESNAIAYANSVLGARTERYGDFLDVLAAIAGRVPDQGLHRAENRRGEMLFRLADDVNRHDPSLYPLVGYAVGLRAAGRIPVIDGLPEDARPDDLKALLAAAASSGSVALAHLVGLTPEAPDIETAFAGRPAAPAVLLTASLLREAAQILTTAGPGEVDAVVLGSPHFSVAEFRETALLVRGATAAPGVRVMITTSQFMYDLAEREGLLEPLRAFGADIICDTCVLLSPILPDSVRTVMTNSGKYAHYIPSLLGRNVVFGSLPQCIEAARSGHVSPDDSRWSS
jgi:predicted aconitase